ncbi:MAG: hypothetical protein E7544_06160 [Ruminococcaceae bacterium]|nr:hypothetical protein [Oscillospiraceae bacterium]
MLKKNKSFLAFIIIAAIFLVWGIFLVPGDELLYSLFGQYIILPVAALICSILSVKKGSLLGWLSPFIFAAVIILLPFTVFGATDLVFVVFAAVPCVLGFVIGALCKLLSGNKKAEAKEAPVNA